MNEQGFKTRANPADALLSVVLPVYNEVRVLRPLVTTIERAAGNLDLKLEIVFVNDGSTDGSARALDQLGNANDHIKIVHLSRNFGHQAAVQAGLSHARGDAVVLMDSDLQDSPAAIAQFVEKWRDGYEVVYAIRTNRKEGPLKRLLFAAFHRFLNRVTTTDVPADAGIFGLLDRRVVDELLSLAERDRYLPGLRSWLGFRQIGVPVERLARYDEKPRVSPAGLWRLAKTAIFGFSSFPLWIFYTIGYSALAVFLVLSGFAVYCKLFTELAIPGWTSHVLSASFFGALNALGISILGEYVVRIYDQVRGRPLFVVDRTVNLEPDEQASFPARGMEEFSDDAALLAEVESLLEMSADRDQEPAVVKLAVAED